MDELSSNGEPYRHRAKAQFSQLKQDKVGCEYYVEDQQYTQDYFKKMDIGFLWE